MRTAIVTFDLLVALVISSTGLLTLVMGVLFGLLVYGERPERGLGGHELTIGLALAQFAIAAAFTAAAIGQRSGAGWAGGAQAAALVLLGLALSFFCAPAA